MSKRKKPVAVAFIGPEEIKLRLECLRMATSSVFETKYYGVAQYPRIETHTGMSDDQAIARANKLYLWVSGLKSA